ncbi:MAG: hypothetical protein SGPRY_014373, partial [Prymnesium sp.]
MHSLRYVGGDADKLWRRKRGGGEGTGREGEEKWEEGEKSQVPPKGLGGVGSEEVRGRGGEVRGRGGVRGIGRRRGQLLAALREAPLLRAWRVVRAVHHADGSPHQPSSHPSVSSVSSAASRHSPPPPVRSPPAASVSSRCSHPLLWLVETLLSELSSEWVLLLSPRANLHEDALCALLRAAAASPHTPHPSHPSNASLGVGGAFTPAVFTPAAHVGDERWGGRVGSDHSSLLLPLGLLLNPHKAPCERSVWSLLYLLSISGASIEPVPFVLLNVSTSPSSTSAGGKEGSGGHQGSREEGRGWRGERSVGGWSGLRVGGISGCESETDGEANAPCLEVSPFQSALAGRLASIRFDGVNSNSVLNSTSPSDQAGELGWSPDALDMSSILLTLQEL